MTKHVLMLSAATAALLAVPVFAAETITTNTTTPKKTSVTGDLTIAGAGSITISTASTPVVEMDSSNFILNEGVLSNIDQTGAIGVFVNATANPVVPTTGFTNNGIINLTGKGIAKIGVQVAGAGGTYTGEISLSQSSNIQIAGDASIGVINDLGMTTKGNFNLGGVITITATTPDSTSVVSDSYLVKQWGTLYGNLTIGQSANFTALGQGNNGVAILGDINACDPTVPACAANPSISPGLFFNGGNIYVLGTLTPNGSKANPQGGYALGIGANIASGAMNSGPINTSNTVNPAVLSGNGVVPTVIINPTTLTGSRAVNIGVFTTDTINPGYSFYNRGFIIAEPIDANLNATGMSIGGADAAAKTTLAPTAAQLAADPTLAGKGGLFNSGLLSAVAGSNNTNAAVAVDATALSITAYAEVPRITVSGETVTTLNPTLGQIVASITGWKGGTAKAVTIGALASVPELNVIKNGRIVASAASNVADITNLSAYAVQDLSDTLKTINNAGTISATATTLNSGTQIANAIDLSLSAADNIVVNNSGIIVGDVLMGQSGNNHRLFVGNVGNVGTNTTTGFGSGGGVMNSATGVANAPTATGGVNGPAIISGNIDFGIGGSAAAPNVLHVGGSGIVSGKVYSRGAGVLDVRVDGNGTLTVQNTQETLRTRTLLVNGGTLNLNVSQGTLTTVPIVTATESATITPGSQIGLSFGSFISSPDPNAPVEQTFTLINAIGATQISIQDAQITAYNQTLSTRIPFLFQPNTAPLALSADRHQLLLKLTPKSPAQLGLTGSATTMFPYVNAALVNDEVLGAALVNGVTSQETAQAAYAQFAPDVSGGMRELAITLTDQAVGPVAARQRNLRQYADQSGGLTLWGHEFAQQFNLKSVSGGTVNSYKDRGFGFVLGMDGGNRQDGWYGGAFTFYTGDIAAVSPLTSKTNTEWYMLTAYTDWKGRHLFLDTQFSVAYGNLLGRRSVSLGGVTRIAEGKRAALMGAIGANTGVTMNFGGIAVVPHISLDGMTMREEKYTETGGGNGLNMNVGSYYATSLRTFVGTDFYRDINLGPFSLRPEARVGYRFDFLNNPVKLETEFVSTGTAFTITGPNSNRGSFLAGISLGASSETWSLGLNYDWLRGAHGSTTQIGTLTLLGRI